MKKFLVLALTFMVSSCAIQMGKVPIIVKNLDQDEINYDELMKKKSEARTKDRRKDCLHIFVFVPTRMTLDLERVLKKSCEKSNYSFDNILKDEFYYFGYGQECMVNESYCENT